MFYQLAWAWAWARVAQLIWGLRVQGLPGLRNFRGSRLWGIRG